MSFRSKPSRNSGNAIVGWGGPDEGPPDVRLDRGNKILWYHANGNRSFAGAANFYKWEMKGTYGIENPEKILPEPYRYNTFGNLVEIRGQRTEDGRRRT